MWAMHFYMGKMKSIGEEYKWSQNDFGTKSYINFVTLGLCF